MSKKPSIDELRSKRIELLNTFIDAKTLYLKNNLSKRLKSVNQQLFTLTKDAKYL
jgi:hypothetical protein